MPLEDLAGHDERVSGASFRRGELSLAHRTILFVEDDPLLQRMMSRHFETLGARVLTAAHYDEALSRLASATPDVVCLDVGLPTRSGFELCETIRGSLGLHELPLLMTSDSDWPAEMAYAEEAGADAVLIKPFTMADLEMRLLALLEGVAPLLPQLRLGA